jgi:hypothetical protein
MSQGLIEAQVSAGCMLFMHSECSALRKSDTADSVLYTQLAATKRHSRFASTSAWNETWLAAFTRFGWALEAHESFCHRPARPLPYSVWGLLRDSLPAFMPVALFSAAESACVRSFERHPDQPAIKLLGREALEPAVASIRHEPQAVQKVVLQLGLLDADGELSMGFITFTHGPELKGNFLFEPLQVTDLLSDVQLHFYSLRMMDPVYAPLRLKVSEALDHHRAERVSALKEVDHVS